MKRSDKELYELAKEEKPLWRQFFAFLERAAFFLYELFNESEDTPFSERPMINTTLDPDADFKQWKKEFKKNTFEKYDKDNLFENGVPVKKLLRNFED